MIETSLFKNVPREIVIKEIEPERPIVLNLPKTTKDQKCMFIFERYRNMVYNRTFFVKIPSGLVGGSGDHAPSIGYRNSIYNDILPYPMEGASAFNSHPTSIPQTAYLVAQKWSGCNYFHWMLTSLPKLLFGMKHNELKDCNAIVCNSVNKPFISETLELVGNNKRVLTFDRYRLMRFRKVVCPSPVGFGAEAASNGAALVKDALKHYASENKHKKFFIKRTGERVVLNYGEVWEALRKRGFEEVCCDGLSVKEQVNLFSQADVIVSPHGAAETNMIFMPEKSKFIELFSPKYMGLCYYYLASSMNFDYSYVVGDGDLAKSADDNYWYSANRESMTININDLNEVLDTNGIQ